VLTTGAAAELESAEVGDGGEPTTKADSRAAELRRKVASGLRKKLDDDLATMFNAINEGDVEAVKLMLDKGFRVNVTDYGQSAPSPDT
jgi:hypothetical protein